MARAGPPARARQAQAGGVDVSVVSFGGTDDPGCRLLVVAADRTQAVIGGVGDDQVWGAFTDDPAVVLVAVEYVRRDLAMQAIAKRFAAEGFDEFRAAQPVLQRLRDTWGAGAGIGGDPV